VMAAVLRVPDTSWYLVAKVDAEEVYAPLRERARWLTVVVGLLVMAAGTTIALLWRNQRMAFYRRQYEAEQLYRIVLSTAMDGVAVVATDGRFLEVNDAYCELAGYSRQELLAMRVEDIEPQYTPELIRQLLPQIIEEGGLRLESRQRRKDGGVIPIEASTTYLPQDEGRLVVFVRDITERKRAEDALRESEAALARSQEELRALAASLLTAQEEERRRVSRELHDDLNQRLAALAIETDMLAARLPLPAGEVRRELKSLEAQAAGLSDDVRRMASQLRPSVLEHLGLAVALRSHCDQFSAREGIPIQFEERGVPGELSPEIALCLYRIAQEAMHNLARHARATRGSVTLAGSAEGVELTLSDVERASIPRRRGRAGGWVWSAWRNAPGWWGAHWRSVRRRVRARGSRRGCRGRRMRDEPGRASV